MSSTDVIGWFLFDNTTEYTAALVTVTFSTLYLSTLCSGSWHICKLSPVWCFLTNLMQHVFMSTTATLAEMQFWTTNITSQYGSRGWVILQQQLFVSLDYVATYVCCFHYIIHMCLYLNTHQLLQTAILKFNILCLFYCSPEHHSCHRMSLWVHNFYTITLPRFKWKQKKTHHFVYHSH